MLRVARIGIGGAVLLCALLFGASATPVAAADGPDMTKFGYPTVAAKMAIAPDQAATLTAGDQSVAIKAGTFDNPVTFELLTATPAMWQNQVTGRTVRAAFAFRVTDTTTNTILAAFKQPVTYTYSGKDAQATDTILNTTAANPPMITPNQTPITFDTAVHHTFGGAGVGWLVVSGGPSGASAAPAPVATGAGGAATVRPAATSATTTTAATAVLPPTGHATSPNALALSTLALMIGGALCYTGMRVRRAHPAR